MIIYDNKNRRYGGAGMDNVYASNPHQYTHEKQIDAFAKKLETLKEDPILSAPVSCLDIGCGQGQMLHLVYEVFRQFGAFKINEADFYGLDVSRVGIEQAENNFSGHSWIVDTFQEFASHEAGRLKLCGSFTFVTNRGGLTGIQSMQEYVEALAQVYDLMRNDGMYFFSQNKSYYQIWANQTYSKHEQSGEILRCDIFEISKNTFEEVEYVELPGDYMLFCRKRSGQKRIYSPRPDKPWSVKFTLNNAKQSTYYISGDALSSPFVRSALSQQNIIEPQRRYNIPKIYSDQQTIREEELSRRCEESWLEGRQSLLFFGNQIRRNSGQMVPMAEATLNALEKVCNPIYFPRVLPTVRDYCRFFPEWLNTAPNFILLGSGLEDHKFYLDPAQGHHPFVDRFEFANRVNWLLDNLRRLNIQPLWISTRINADMDLPDKRFRIDAQEAQVFSAIEQAACAKYGVPRVALPHSTFDSANAVKSAFKSLVQQLITKPCAALKDPTFGSGNSVGSRAKKLLRGLIAKPMQIRSLLSTCEDDKASLADNEIWFREIMFRPPSQETEDLNYHFPVSGDLTLSDGRILPIHSTCAKLLYFSAPEVIYNNRLNDGVYDVKLLNGVDMWSRSAQLMLVRYLASRIDKKKPNVMVLGDSTRMRARDLTGYGLPAYVALLPHANIIHVPNNFGGSIRQLEIVPSLVRHMRPDIVHMNAGLHDLMVNRLTGTYNSYQDIDKYRQNVKSWIKAIEALPSSPRVIWGTCTPIHENWHNTKPNGKASDWIRNLEDVVKYNTAACEIASGLGVPINDLYDAVMSAGLESCILRDGVHLSAKGSQVCGAKVAESIRSVIAAKTKLLGHSRALL